ncbi:MAG: hypothetical protein HQL12_02860 [Candidatus Omnitrophica bacterium]|nr:hypothetical protein [Candidatus Omnitrophota bacterium]
MNRKFGIGVLVACFSLSSVNVSLAVQATEVSPIVVQPCELRELNQQMLEQDRLNRDQELAIRGIIDDNQKLTDTALARKQDATLEKINQTMINYRDSLLSRDRTRIMTNSQRTSQYDDLIKLTEDVNDMKSIGQTLVLKRDVIEEKYKILSDLKDEMIAVNEKLKKELFNKDYFKISRLQEAKIQLLTQELAEMDTKTARFDEILAQKDRQIAILKSNLAAVQNESAAKDEMIKEKKGQLELLKTELEKKITEIQSGSASKDELIKEKIGQVELLKAELEKKIAEVQNGSAIKDAIIKEKQGQTDLLKAELEKRITQENSNGQLEARIQQQAAELKIKNDSIRWLNQVAAAAKAKAEYYKLTSLQDQMTVNQIQGEVQKIKDDFAEHFKNFGHFENTIVLLNAKVGRLGQQLSLKQQEVDSLKSELRNKINQEGQQESKIQQDLKVQLQDKENQIAKMKADILAILQARENKEIFLRNASARLKDHLNLAKQLIDLQGQETTLLDEKDKLEAIQNAVFEKHAMALEKTIRTLLANQQMQTEDLKSRMEELKNELNQKQQQADSLKSELENNISEQKNQNILSAQIQELKTQLQYKEGQITAMKAEIRSGKENQVQVDILKQQSADQQNKVELLKQELDGKITQSDKMTEMIGEYQKKLESKDSAFNEQLGKLMVSKNYQALMEKKIADLNIQLQDKEAQVVRIKMDMYDLQKLTSNRLRDMQTRDLSLSTVQKKMMDKQITEYQGKVNGLQGISDRQLEQLKSLKTELSLAYQKLKDMPGSDEIDFLKAGLLKATVELKQKNETILKTRANADEYEKEFKKQIKEFQSLTEQFLNARREIDRKDEDLRYKNMEIARLKERAKTREGILKSQVMALTRELESSQKELTSKAKRDVLQEKLKQALKEIDEQDKVINVLVQKLRDAGQNVNLTKYFGKQ